MSKNKRIIAVAILICFFPQVALAESAPYIPVMPPSVAATSTVIAISPSIMYSTHLGRSPTTFRGDFTENLMRSYLAGGRDLSSSKTWYPLDPGAIQVVKGGNLTLLDPSKTGRAGIDGVFMQFDSKGRPSSAMIAESKFGGSKLGTTKYHGKQMSDQWVSPRARAVGTHYQMMSELARGGRLRQTNQLPGKVVKATAVPINNKKSIAIWWDSDVKSYVYYAEKNVDGKLIAKQLDRMSQYMFGVADGKITVRKVLWHVEVDAKGVLSVTAEHVDADGNLIKGTKQVVKPLSQKYSQLSAIDRQQVDKALLEALKKQYSYLPPSEAERAAQSTLKEAHKKDRIDELIKRYNPNESRWNWRTSTRGVLLAGGMGVLFTAAFHGVSWMQGGSFDGTRLFKDMCLSFLSASGGAFAGFGTSYIFEKMARNQLLSSSQSLLTKILSNGANTASLSRLLGGTVGGMFASAIFAYGYALVYGGSWQDANRMMVTGVASSAAATVAGYAILQTAMLVGTASTGTAISTLSGAVATKTALAWLGGGAISAGGGGVVVGGIVLSAGVLLVGVGVGYLISQGWQALDSNNRAERLDSLLNAYR